MPIELRTLGGVDLRREDGAELSTLLAQPKRIALLAYLATARPRGFHGRDALLALFWPEADAERARNSLRQALHHLRRSLGEGAVPGRGEREVGLDPAVVRCDAAAFDEAVERERWGDAVALYAGDFLPALFVHDAPEAERWIEEERARRRRDAADAARRLADERLAAGDPAAAERAARFALALEPADEGALRRLIAALDGAGDAAGAIAAHADFARRLREEHGLAPSVETERLVGELRGRRPAPAPPPAATAPAAAPEMLAATPPPAVIALPEPVPVVPPPAAPSAGTPRARRRPLRVAAVAALVVVAAGAGWWATARARTAPIAAAAAPVPSIAVLPFVNLSGDPANDFFSDGVSEELLNLLAQVPGLQVAARTSSFTFRGKDVAVDSIGRALRVRHVLEGSVRRSGERVRITAQLIDAESGYHLWSGNFDGRLEDVFAVQDSIGRVIVETLRPRLAGGAPAQAPRRIPSDPEAHVAVMRGWRAFRQNTREAWEAAAAHFEEAIRRDSLHAPAYAGLANVRQWQANFRHRPQAEGYAEAEVLARRAVALDSTLAEPHIVLGRVAEARDQRSAEAERHYARAAALAPSDPRPHQRLATLLVRLGRADEAIAEGRRAVDLDPASPAAYADLANAFYALGRWREQETALRAALALDPGHPILMSNLALSLSSQERFAEAESAMVRARRRTPDESYLVGAHAYIVARLGRGAEARALLDTAAAGGVSPVSLAATWAVLGERERAIALLERAVRERDDRIGALLDTTMLGDLRRDPRVRRLVEEVRALEAATPPDSPRSAAPRRR